MAETQDTDKFTRREKFEALLVVAANMAVLATASVVIAVNNRLEAMTPVPRTDRVAAAQAKITNSVIGVFTIAEVRAVEDFAESQIAAK